MTGQTGISSSKSVTVSMAQDEPAPTRGKTAQYKGRKVREGQVSTVKEMKTRAKQEGVTKGNKEMGPQEHMVDTNKDKAMC